LLSIEKDFFKKIIFILSICFLTLCFVSYLLIEIFQTSWFFVVFAYILIFSALSFYIKQKLKKLTDDINTISTYVEDINNKNYNAIVKVENYIEFLKISINLKNIAKRLNSKTKR